MKRRTNRASILARAAGRVKKAAAAALAFGAATTLAPIEQPFNISNALMPSAFTYLW